MTSKESFRAEALLAAQAKAVEMFRLVAEGGLLRAGVTESQINQEVYDLAEQRFGVRRYWHKRIVRAGANTLLPYAEDPPDLTVREGDILFLDLGPVFEEWEADFGRTFVIGNDAAKCKLRDDTARAFADGKAYYNAKPHITGAELYAHAQQLAAHYGWEFGGPIAGHLIGQFPHERIPEDKVTLYVHPGNHGPMRALGADGKPRHWILEIHFVDRARGIGGYFEELLTL
ncbi:MAG TPA: M24 family metallopeptidase [Terriglobales bacterium]|nr:M24 family metallopeptidase [Terriglobales bacterium]